MNKSEKIIEALKLHAEITKELLSMKPRSVGNSTTVWRRNTPRLEKIFCKYHHVTRLLFAAIATH